MYLSFIKRGCTRDVVQNIVITVSFASTLLISQLLVAPTTFAAQPIQTQLRDLSSFLAWLERTHPRLKISQAELDGAKARTWAASKPLYNPELDFNVERSGKTDTFTIGLNQTIDWRDKRSARRNIATIEQELSLYKQEENRQQLLADIFSALTDYNGQREILYAHTKRLSLIKQLLGQATLRYKAGDISKLDLEQIRLNLSKSQLTVNRARTQLTFSQQILAEKAGKPLNDWPVLPYAPPIIQPVNLNYDQIILNLPAYKAQLTRIAVAWSTLELRIREQKPDPTIGFRAGGEGSNKVIGLTLSIPLNVRDDYSPKVDEARSNIQYAERTLDNILYQLQSRLKLTAQNYQLSYSSWKTWQKVASENLKNQSQLLLRLWKAGELSTSDYLLRLDQILEAEFNHVELQANVWKAWFNWMAVSNQFDQWLTARIK